jgi:hypothetical protein
VADQPNANPNILSDGSDKGKKRRTPFSVAQARRELRDAQRTLKDYEARNVQGQLFEDAKKAVRDAEKALKDLTTGPRDERREARQDFMDEYYNELGGPWVAELIKRDPELRRIFEKAIRNDDLDGFMDDLYQSDWWNDPKRSGSWKSAFQKEYAKDKTAWNDGLKDAAEIIRREARNAGVVLTEDQVTRLSRRYWYEGWNEDADALTSWMQQRAKNQRENAVTDPEAEVDPLLPANRNQTISQLRDLAEAYGLEFDDQVLGDWADLILDPKKNTDDIEMIRFKEFLVQESRSKYVTFGDQLDADTNLRQLAGGYVSELTRLLEIDPTSIRFTPTGMDPLLQRALTNIDPETGKPSRIPLWEFTKQIRQDDRWQMTDNARDTYMGAASRFAQALGLAG